MKSRGLITLAVTALTLTSLALTSCRYTNRGSSDDDYDDDEKMRGEVLVDNIAKVKDGNVVITSMGMPVKLLGVKGGYERGTTFLKKYIGKEIHVIEDSHMPQDPIGADTIWGYAVLADGQCINHLLLEQEPQLYDVTYLEDSLNAFKPREITTGKIPDLGLYIKQRSFLIEVPLGGGVSSYGTGFFINDKGLALTNHHVIDGTTPAYCNLYDPTSIDDSEIYSHLRRDIKRSDVIWTDEDLDITIFRVSLEPDDQTSYLNLAKRHVPQGTAIGTIGNPVSTEVLAGSYSGGEVSAYRHQSSKKPLVQYTLSTNGGNSGGAICDPTGNVIAVHAMGDKSMQNVNYGIDILAVRKALDEIGEYYGGK